MSLADIAMLAGSEFLHMGLPDYDLAANCADWNSIVCAVKQDAKIAKHIEERPKTEF